VRLNYNLETLTMRLPTSALDCCAKDEKSLIGCMPSHIRIMKDDVIGWGYGARGK